MVVRQDAASLEWGWMKVLGEESVILILVPAVSVRLTVVVIVVLLTDILRLKKGLLVAAAAAAVCTAYYVRYMHDEANS